MSWRTSLLSILFSCLALILGFIVGEWFGVIVVGALILVAGLFAAVIRSNNKATSRKPANSNTSGDYSQPDSNSALLIPLLAMGTDDTNHNSKDSTDNNSTDSTDTGGGFWNTVGDFFSGSGGNGGGDGGGSYGGGYDGGGGGGDGGGGGGGD